MRDKLSWPDLRGKRVGLLGYGVEGRANARACLAIGVSPEVVVDDHQADGAVACDENAVASLRSCDVVIKSPGFSIYSGPVRDLRDGGVNVTTGLALWLNTGLDRRRVVGVTGTKGKSTTSTLIAHLIRSCGASVSLSGNIGSCVWDPELAGTFDYWVLEISSYQAATLLHTPSVIAVTSLAPDHLTWHMSLDNYYRDKLSICMSPDVRVVFANALSDELVAHSKLLGPRVKWIDSSGDERFAKWASAAHLIGAHNVSDVAIAVETARSLDIELTDSRIASALSEFQPLPHRLETVGRIGGVDFVDDGLATNAVAAVAAVNAFPNRKVALIAGGEDRGISYRPLVDGLQCREPPVAVFAIAEAGERILASFVEEHGNEMPFVVRSLDLPSAVHSAYLWARPDGVVLLSPAAPSYGVYKDYRDRGRHFKQIYEQILPIAADSNRADLENS